MPCQSCADRRKILADAAARGGAPAVVKALPSVFRHIVMRKPKAQRVIDPKA